MTTYTLLFSKIQQGNRKQSYVLDIIVSLTFYKNYNWSSNFSEISNNI